MSEPVTSYRTNYFRVKDIEAFLEWCKILPKYVEVWEKSFKECCPASATYKEDLDPDQRMFGLGCWGEGMPTGCDIQYATEMKAEVEGKDYVESDEHEDFDLIHELSFHLADGEVLIAQEISQDKLRWLTSWATVIDSKQNVLATISADAYMFEKILGEREFPVTLPLY